MKSLKVTSTARKNSIKLVVSSFSKTRLNVERTVNDQFAIVNEEFIARAEARKLSNPASFDIELFYADTTVVSEVLKSCYQEVDKISSEGKVSYKTDKLNKLAVDTIANLVTIGGIRNQKTFDTYLAKFNGQLYRMATEAILFAEPTSLVKSLVTCGLLDSKLADKTRKNVSAIFGKPRGVELAIASVYRAGAGRNLSSDEVLIIKKAMKAYSAAASLARATKGTSFEQSAPSPLVWKTALLPVLTAPKTGLKQKKDLALSAKKVA